MALRKGYVDLVDGQIHYVSRPGDGVPIAFFHQTASNWEMWAKVIAVLPEGQPVYAFDTPGFGGSFDPPGEPAMSDYARWMAAACDALGIARAHIVGHHTGAAIAAELAAARPDLAASVALIGPLCLNTEERAESAKLYGAPFVPNASGSYLLDTWNYLHVGGATVDPLLAHREMIGMLRAYLGRPQAYGAVWGHDFDAAFRAIACPLQILCAPDDVLWAFFERARAIRPDADAVVLETGSNFEPDLAAADVVRAIAAHVGRGIRE